MTGAPLAPAILPALAAAAPSRGDLPDWFAAAAPLLVAGAWIAATSLVALAAGHFILLARFPPCRDSIAERFQFVSGRVRWANLNNGLFVGIGARALHLGPSWPFRPLFRRGVPCIPWSEIRLVRPGAPGVLEYVRGPLFEIRSVGLRFSLRGRAGEAVAKRLAAGGGGEPAPRSRMIRGA
jgi:hypothetical protein